MAAIHMNGETFAARIREEKPVLVIFGSPRCGYCCRLEPACDRIAGQFGDLVTLARVDVDAEPELAEREQIEVLPTLVLYRRGTALDSIVAPESAAMICRFLRGALEQEVCI